MQAVAALGHVGVETAVKVAVRETRQLFEEGGAQPVLELASEAQYAGGDRDLHEEEGDQEHQQRRYRGQSLAGQPEVARKDEEPAQQQRLDDHSG